MDSDSSKGSKQSREQVPTQDSSRRLLMTALIIAAAFIFLIFANQNYGFLKNLFGLGQDQTFGDKLPGYLLLGLVSARSDVSTPSIVSLVYDFLPEELQNNGFDKLAAAPEGNNVAYQHVLSGNGNQVTFLGATNVENTSSIQDLPLQIYRADISRVLSYEAMIEALQNAEQVTEGGGIFRQAPSISNKGEVLYMGHAPDVSGALFGSEANDWDIHLVSLLGRDTVLAQGIHPKWVSDDKFVFLKNDGLYAHSLADGRTQKLWGMEGTATMSMSLDVSNDYKLLAWTGLESETVTILRSFGWSEGNVLLQQELPIEGGVAAVISPDNNLIAIQALAPEGGGGLLTTIGFFEIASSLEVAKPLIFADVDPTQTHITDWGL